MRNLLRFLKKLLAELSYSLLYDVLHQVTSHALCHENVPVQSHINSQTPCHLNCCFSM